MVHSRLAFSGRFFHPDHMQRMPLLQISWRLWFLIFAVAGLETAGIFMFDHISSEAHQSRAHLSDMELAANRLNALEWEAIASGSIESQLIADISANREELRHASEELKKSGVYETSLRIVDEIYLHYADSVDKELDQIRAGHMDVAREVDATLVDPAFDALGDSLKEIRGQFEARSRMLSHLDLIGSLLATTVGSVAVILLFVHALRTRAAVDRATSDRLVLEESLRSEQEIRLANEGLEKRVRERTAELEHLNRMIVDAGDQRQKLEVMVQQISEQERRKLGSDLHDGVGQLLTGIALRTKVLETRLAASGSEETPATRIINQMLGEALTQTQSLAGLLYPAVLEEYGLEVALQMLAEKLSTQFGIPCEHRVSTPLPLISPDKAIHLYRIAQEAATNALRHARPTLVSIRSGWAPATGTFTLEIVNDGEPMETVAGRFDGMGCHIMSFRAQMLDGSLTISPRLTGGCLVNLLCHLDSTPTSAIMH